MQLDKFREGLEIFSRYYNNPSGYHIGAEHDVFYVCATDTPLSETDLKRVVELGWFQEGGSNDEEDTTEYLPEEGWQAFT